MLPRMASNSLCNQRCFKLQNAGIIGMDRGLLNNVRNVKIWGTFRDEMNIP